MNPETYHIIGIMSGTSVDGIDFAYAEFTKDDTWSYKIIAAETVEYDSPWIRKLREAIDYPKEKLRELDIAYTAHLVTVTKDFIARHCIKNLDAVCSHGHTILHRPDEGRTYQIGNRPELAARIGQRVVCDFRVQDVVLGGQGAPLVPVGDLHLFAEYDLCLNIGGFANCSFEANGQRMAYDICPANIVLNKYANFLGRPYDAGGDIAASHYVDEKLLAAIGALPFYRKPYPKSLGLEWVNEVIFPMLDTSRLSAEIILATFTCHIAVQISHAINSLFGESQHSKVLITGGGAYNTHLVNLVRDLVPAQVIVPDAQTIEFKEALIFGFMGVLRLRNTTNVLASVTGASQDHCAGTVLTS